MILSRLRRLFPHLFLTLLCSLAFCSSLQATIRYEISLAHPEQHLFHVVMIIPDVDKEVVVRIPAWNALYQIRDFSSHIQRVEAFEIQASAGVDPPTENPAAIEKVDKQTWRINAHGTVKIRYGTYWDEAGPFASQLNQEHAFINPAMILMYVAELRHQDIFVTIGDIPDFWRAASTGAQMDEYAGRAHQWAFEFLNYDALADAPIEAGRFEEFQLEGLKPEVWVAIHGDAWKKKQVESDLRRICEYEIKLMGGAPYGRYTFIFHIGKAAAAGGGGMEHADGTAISVASGDTLQNVAAHEFFHLWNVKRIIPATLYPVDYSQEQYTRALWFAEGVTNTYASYTLERTGLWTRQQFYHDLGEQISELEARSANHWQSVEQSSLDAWLEKYPLYENPAHSVSYYTKGQVLGVLLDILIRDRTDNGKSLDDVMRIMNRDFAVAGKTYRDSLDVQLIAEKLTGVSFEEFFKRYIAGADPLPYRATLALAGLELREVERKRPTLGFTTAPAAGGMLAVSNVESDGPAAAAGLKTGDTIVKWNGNDPPRRPNDWLRQQKGGGTIHLRVRRDDVEINIDVRPGELTETFYDIVDDPHADEKALHIRDGLLHGATDAAAVHASN